jgi:hypothetical protein
MAGDSLSIEKERELEKAINEVLSEGKLQCAMAFKVAKQHGVAPGTVGDVANKLGIKIKNCQLGCFP